MPSAASLHIHRLNVQYRQRRVIEELALPPLQAGEVLGLVGPNAAGKSTLLRALAGLVPAQGEVDYGKQSWLSMSLSARSKAVGFMPQRLPDDTSLSVFESVLLALQNEAQGSQAERRTLEVLERLGILDLSMRSLQQLSGGQRQMVGLAQAVVRGSPVLLLDEPISALDLAHQWHVLDTVRQLAREGRIVIVVLHDLTLAAQWADRVAVLKEGRLLAFGTPEAAIEPSVLRRAYGVEARVQRCDKGCLYVMVDGLSDPDVK